MTASLPQPILAQNSQTHAELDLAAQMNSALRLGGNSQQAADNEALLPTLASWRFREHRKTGA